MDKTQRIILYALTLIAGISWTVLTSQPLNLPANITSAPQKGFVAPDLTLTSTKGTSYTLSELKGQAVLINLWATWCPPCRAEMPAIEKMYQEYKDRGLVVLAINVSTQDDPSAVVPFTNEYNLTFPILLDETGGVASSYQLQSLPSSFFVNRSGIISDIVIGGPMSEALLRTRIEAILN